MKKYFILFLCAASVCFGVPAAARVAPDFPAFVQLESGKDYYFYNVKSGKFLSGGNLSVAIVEDAGLRTTVTSIGDGEYSVLFSSTGGYLHRASNGSIYINGRNSYYECGWLIALGDNDTYVVQNIPENSSYDETQFLGVKDGSDKVVYPCTASEGGIEWKLIDGDTGDYYCARLRLYNVLEAADAMGVNVDKFEQIYNNDESSPDALNQAAAVLSNSLEVTSNYVFPEWNDYKILLEPSEDEAWKLSSNSTTLEADVNSGDTSTLTATVVVDRDATLSYELRYGSLMQVKLDGIEIKSFNDKQLDASGINENHHFIELSPGKHIVQWIASRPATPTGSSHFYIYNIGVVATPLITVDLLEPGSLGTEILYNVNHIKDVRKLKINGSMNADDWKIISMMKDSLFVLDLSGTDIQEIADECFAYWPFLHSVSLPEGLLRIGSEAFSSTPLDYVNFPSTLTTIGRYAFYNTNIVKAILPENCLNLSSEIFMNCRMLEEAALPDKLTAIPSYMFESCCVLKEFKLPSKLVKIGTRAFFDCNNAAFELPESLTTIGNTAFYFNNQAGKKTDLVIPKNVSYVGENAFLGCKYTYAEMPVAYYKISGYNPCLPESITTLRLNCPTVVEVDVKRIVNDSQRSGITLQVPSFLVNSYKLDEYWYEFGAIEGFDTDEIDEWVLNSDLVLGARDRLAGTPSIRVNASGSLKVNGTDGMPINEMSVQIDPDNTAYGRMFSNADDVIIGGGLNINMRLGSANKWYFLSLPYNVKVSDIRFTENSPQRAIRYYDGANRAANGATGSWKNFAEDDIIPAGTGFIFQVSEAGSWNIPALEDESKQYISSNKMFVKALAANPSENASDRGWNLVGNPYQCWYNIHMLNFTAPITVREGNNYAAYSVIDDDYALAPNQAFFVQCPDGISDISFPLDGRQMTSLIESQSGAKLHGTRAVSANRALADIAVSNGVETDRTRIVINDEATLGYDVNSDACKFMTESAGVPQLYSYDAESTKYAINERPVSDGVVRLGFKTDESGVFTMRLQRNSIGDVILVDNERGITVNLALQDYEFTADAGENVRRFELRLKDTATDIENDVKAGVVGIQTVDGGIMVSGTQETVNVFTLAGTMVYSGCADGGGLRIPLSAGTYIVRVGGQTLKVIVQ